jgi:hypothetical protein
VQATCGSDDGVLIYGKDGALEDGKRLCFNLRPQIVMFRFLDNTKEEEEEEDPDDDDDDPERKVNFRSVRCRFESIRLALLANLTVARMFQPSAFARAR